MYIYYIIINFTKEYIITTDKYYNAFPNFYYKTDVIFNNCSTN